MWMTSRLRCCRKRWQPLRMERVTPDAGPSAAWRQDHDPAKGLAVGHGLEGDGQVDEGDLATDDGSHPSISDQLKDASVDALAVSVGGEVVTEGAFDLSGIFGIG